MNFGKRCMIFACLIINTISFAFANDMNNKKILEETAKEFFKSWVELENRTKECKIEKKLDLVKIKNLLPDVKPEYVQLSLLYFERRNLSKCVYKAENNVLFTLSSLELLLEDFKEKGVKIEEIRRINNNYNISRTRYLLGGISPDMRYLKADYMALPERVRVKIEAIEEFKSGYFKGLQVFKSLYK